MNLDDMSSDEEEARPDAPAPAQQPQDGVVSQREAEKILAEAEQRLEDECREMLATPHGRDALAFEAARSGPRPGSRTAAPRIRNWRPRRRGASTRAVMVLWMGGTCRNLQNTRRAT